jgi:hypothetical protein
MGTHSGITQTMFTFVSDMNTTIGHKNTASASCDATSHDEITINGSMTDLFLRHNDLLLIDWLTQCTMARGHIIATWYFNPFGDKPIWRETAHIVLSFLCVLFKYYGAHQLIIRSNMRWKVLRLWEGTALVLYFCDMRGGTVKLLPPVQLESAIIL